jgi:hypothetical protein
VDESQEKKFGLRNKGQNDDGIMNKGTQVTSGNGKF